MGRVFNWSVKAIAVPGIQDTQCGFKCFRAAAAEDLFGIQRVPGWGFDVEILHLALKRGYRVVELPIDWRYQAGEQGEARRGLVPDAAGRAAGALALAARGLRQRPISRAARGEVTGRGVTIWQSDARYRSPSPQPCRGGFETRPPAPSQSPFPLDKGRLEPAPYSIRGWG